MLNKYISLNIGIGIMVLIVGGVFQWLNISPGNLIDWSIGIASFWWLLAIITIPWNIYFDARETLNEGKTSQAKNIKVDVAQLNYVRKVARWSIISAIALHFVSAIVLYALAATGISNVGYVSSGLTLLLTVLRPAIRGYQYLNAKLLTIKKEIKIPREDAVEIKNKVEILEDKIKKLAELLDTNKSDSLISQQQHKTQQNQQQIARLNALLEADRARNDVEHERLARESKNAIAQLTEDSQFLGHVREIIRFVKTT